MLIDPGNCKTACLSRSANGWGGRGNNRLSKIECKRGGLGCAVLHHEIEDSLKRNLRSFEEGGASNRPIIQ